MILADAMGSSALQQFPLSGTHGKSQIFVVLRSGLGLHAHCRRRGAVSAPIPVAGFDCPEGMNSSTSGRMAALPIAIKYAFEFNRHDG